MLDPLYRGCGVLAAICLVGIAALILAQIIGRLLGFIIPSADDFAGYLMAASTFLALAYTLRMGGHIRVTMVIRYIPESVAYWLELFVIILGATVSGYFAWFMIDMVWQSYQYKEVSQGHVPTPLWIPQSILAFGLVVLSIAFLEEIWRILSGQMPTYNLIEHTEHND